MDLASIVAELKRERDRLDNAIAALEGMGSGRRGRRGRGPGAGASNGRRRGGRRHMSAEARRRISEMMKKRWAERKRRAA